MDELSFGPRRESRRSARHRRALAAVSLAGVAAAGAVFAVTAAGPHHPAASPHPASQAAARPAPAVRLPSAGCPPAHRDWPSLAGLPAGLRLAARPVIIDAQFSGRCAAP